MESFKTYALKTIENNNIKYSGRPFATTNGTIYQMLRDLDITFEVRPDQTYSVYLIELENIIRSYSLDRLNHKNIHKFDIFINSDRIQQLQYGEQMYISNFTQIDGKRFELKFNLICKKNYDYDINFSSDINNDYNGTINQQPDQPNQENNQTNNMVEPIQITEPNQQPQNDLNWANDKIYLLTLPSLEIRYI